MRDTLGRRVRPRSRRCAARGVRGGPAVADERHAIASRTIACRRRPTRSSPRANGRRCTWASGDCSWSTRRPRSIEDEIFDVVNQLDQGAALMTSGDERERIAELNLMAGKRAQRSTAYASALRYFAAGAALLGEDCWARRYELTFALELHRAECELPDRRARGGGAAARRSDPTRGEHRSTRPPSHACKWISTRPPVSLSARSTRASPTCGASASIGRHTRRRRRCAKSSRACGSGSAAVRSRI